MRLILTMFVTILSTAAALAQDDARFRNLALKPALQHDRWINGRVGSLEVGKDGDLALFDGDPFEFTSHVMTVIIDGQVVSQEVR